MSLGFIFPGQGSQSVGMLKELAANFASRLGTQLLLSHVIYQALPTLADPGPLLGRFRAAAFPEDTDVAFRLSQSFSRLGSLYSDSGDTARSASMS